MERRKGISTQKMVMGAVLTALVVVLQLISSFMKIGPFAITLVLVPIVIGAATCGVAVGGWLGFVFGIVVLFTDAASFLAIDPLGTVITVLAKGIACGVAAGLVYKLFEKKNKYLAVGAAAVVCPVVNTGVFFLGCVLFFFKTIESWGLAKGFGNAVEYMFLGMAGINFLIELAINIVLAPVVIRLLSIRKNQE